MVGFLGKKKCIVLGVAVAAFGILAFFLAQPSMNFAFLFTHKQSTDTAPSIVTQITTEACVAEIDGIGVAATAVYIGDAYFGGDRGYQLQCARAAYARATALDPRGDRLAWYQLGRIDFLEGNFGAALNKFRKQIEYFGDEVPNVHYMIGLTNGYAARKSGEAMQWSAAEDGFKRYLEFFPESPWGRTDLAWVLFSQGKYEDMKPILEKGLEFEPEHAWLLNMYGLALLNTGERARAHEYFLRAKEAATLLTPEMWGSAYPGNDPKSWAGALEEMQKAIQYNVELSVTEN